MALRCAAGGAYLTREEADAAASALGDPHPPPRGTRAHLPPVGPVLTILQGSMGVGVFLGCVGCYQLWKAAPSIFVDAALAYAFYKLSVVSSEVCHQGKCNDLLTRLNFGYGKLLWKIC
ncbi:hypothetical protein D1007_05442 [Hordeum vulgare]|nr:hypothetical protein D1007_05442 [Hordeum vulgare]